MFPRSYPGTYLDTDSADLHDICSTATIPLYARMADLFGRRYVMLSAVAVFLIGTGLIGDAKSEGMLIVGLNSGGAGGGGMTMLIDVIRVRLASPEPAWPVHGHRILRCEHRHQLRTLCGRPGRCQCQLEMGLLA